MFVACVPLCLFVLFLSGSWPGIFLPCKVRQDARTLDGSAGPGLQADGLLLQRSRNGRWVNDFGDSGRIDWVSIFTLFRVSTSPVAAVLERSLQTIGL